MLRVLMQQYANYCDDIELQENLLDDVSFVPIYQLKCNVLVVAGITKQPKKVAFLYPLMVPKKNQAIFNMATFLDYHH